MKKNALALLLAACLALCLFAGCRKDNTPSDDTGVITQSDTAAAQSPLTLSGVVPGTADSSFDCVYSGDKHSFSVYLPENGGEGSPLVIMLHGYGNSITGMRAQTHFDDEACVRGYTVVYAGSAASGWNSGADSSDKNDLGFLTALAGYVQEKYGCDSDRTFAAGFSNGAFMIHRLAADSPDTFRGFCSVAGFMPAEVWERRPGTASVSFMQIYGTRDDVVPMKANGSADSSVNPAIEDVMDYWAQANGLSSSRSVSLSDKAVMTEYSGGGSNAVVSTVVVEGMRHSWPQEDFAGFDANGVILDFFDSIQN